MHSKNVRRLTVRRLAGGLMVLAGLVLAALPVPAAAGEFAQVDLLGFSRSGSHFAFEEFGVQDGSGFPYSNIYVIDVGDDSWVSGTPLRRLDEVDDSQPLDFAEELARTRAANRDAANDVLGQTGIAGFGQTVGHNPPTERTSDPHLMIATTNLSAPTIGGPVTLALQETPVAKPGNCPDGFGTIQGMKLTLTHEGETRVLADDSHIPKSRGCPLRYRIERFVTHTPVFSGPTYFAVLVLMEKIGFEGPDGRFLAITGKL
jgi:predicted secreted protein